MLVKYMEILRENYFLILIEFNYFLLLLKGGVNYYYINLN